MKKLNVTNRLSIRLDGTKEDIKGRFYSLVEFVKYHELEDLPNLELSDRGDKLSVDVNKESLMVVSPDEDVLLYLVFEESEEGPSTIHVTTSIFPTVATYYSNGDITVHMSTDIPNRLVKEDLEEALN